MVCGTWYVKRGMWYVVCETWYVKRGMWYVVCGMWNVVCGMWYGSMLKYYSTAIKGGGTETYYSGIKLKTCQIWNKRNFLKGQIKPLNCLGLAVYKIFLATTQLWPCGGKVVIDITWMNKQYNFIYKIGVIKDLPVGQFAVFCVKRKSQIQKAT